MRVLEGLNLGWRTRLPMVLQAEAAECGLACISMVAAYHGYKAEMAELRRNFGMSLRGATLKDVVRMADRLKLAARPVRLELDELKRLKTPCILHWELNHFVVLKSVAHKSVTIHDPAIGVRNLSLSEVSKLFTGVALELSPMSGFQASQSPPRVRMRALVGQLVGVKRSLGQVRPHGTRGARPVPRAGWWPRRTPCLRAHRWVGRRSGARTGAEARARSRPAGQLEVGRRGDPPCRAPPERRLRSEESGGRRGVSGGSFPEARRKAPGGHGWRGPSRSSLHSRWCLPLVRRSRCLRTRCPAGGLSFRPLADAASGRLTPCRLGPARNGWHP